jgi:hypothetical protein
LRALLRDIEHRIGKYERATDVDVKRAGRESRIETLQNIVAFRQVSNEWLA